VSYWEGKKAARESGRPSRGMKIFWLGTISNGGEIVKYVRRTCKAGTDQHVFSLKKEERTGLYARHRKREIRNGTPYGPDW